MWRRGWEKIPAEAAGAEGILKALPGSAKIQMCLYNSVCGA